MSRLRPMRRRFFQTGAALASGLAVHSAITPASQAAEEPTQQNLGIGCIGLRYQGSVIAYQAAKYGKVVAVCDVDRHVRDQAKASFGSTPHAFEDYRDLLERNDVDVVTIGTPDHWHTKMVIDACRAGKNVYCEKPLTLTIEEGKQLTRVVKETGRVVQVGSWQRSDHRFRLAVELVRSGRIGNLQRVDVVLGKNKVGGPFKAQVPPQNLNWNLWQGQTPDVPYLQERCHYTFRWWKEYSGGQMTDWGAHHLDIAQWAINSYPTHIKATSKWPDVDVAQAGKNNSYNVPVDFNVTYRYQNGVVMTVSDTGRNGILFTGDAGRIFVNRGTLSGRAVEELVDKPLNRKDWQLYDFDNLYRPERAGKLDAITNHMGNFFDCIEHGRQPISDVDSQHRSVSTCHLGNLAIELDRELSWDPAEERFVDDKQADALMSRPQRKGFEVT